MVATRVSTPKFVVIEFAFAATPRPRSFKMAEHAIIPCIVHFNMAQLLKHSGKIEFAAVHHRRLLPLVVSDSS